MLTAVQGLWDQRNRPVFTSVTNPKKFPIFSIEHLSRFGWWVHCSSSICKMEEFWQAAGPRLPTYSLHRQPRGRYSTRIPVYVSHSWLIFIQVQPEKIKPVRFPDTKGDTHTSRWEAHNHLNGGCNFGTTGIQDLSMLQLPLNIRNTLILES